MALIPLLLDYLHNQPERQITLPDQHFGHGLGHEDLLVPLISQSFPSFDARALIPHPSSRHYLRAWRSPNHGGGATLSVDRQKFQVNLDVQQFSPEEITVKVTGDDVITVEGKHEEKEDEHGFVSRHFVRRYIVPKGHDMEKIESKLSSDGVLSILVPKVKAQAEGEHREVPITQTGQPSARPAAVGKKAEKESVQENGTNE